MTDKTSQPNPPPPAQPEIYVHGDDSAFTHQLHARRTTQYQAQWFLPYLQPGMTLLDCGCATGSITVGLAAAVAPGQVIGVDRAVDEIERARARAAGAAVPNLRFDVGDIYQLEFPDNHVDAIFCHNVLEHIGEPRRALREMHRVLKVGGVIGVREPDTGGHIFGPTEGPMRELYDLWAQMIQRNDGNPYLGRALRALLHQADCRDVMATASYESHGTPESIAVFRSGGAGALGSDGGLGRGLLNANLIDEPQLAALRVRVEAWVDDPVCFIARPWCEAVGWKPGSSAEIGSTPTPPMS